MRCSGLLHSMHQEGAYIPFLICAGTVVRYANAVCMLVAPTAWQRCIHTVPVSLVSKMCMPSKLHFVCRRMLESRGLIVRSIPFYEWSNLGSIDQQKIYLSRLLTSAYAFTYR